MITYETELESLKTQLVNVLGDTLDDKFTLLIKDAQRPEDLLQIIMSMNSKMDHQKKTTTRIAHAIHKLMRSSSA